MQVIVVLAALLTYREIRVHAEGAPTDALRNALDVIDIQRAVGLYHEKTLQEWFTGWEPITRAWNVFYGLMHDAAGYLTLIFLWRRAPRPEYRFWRNVVGWMLLLGLVGFFTYPITPPRLMPEEYGFVDTGVDVGGIGPIQGATEDAGGNRFAAMPSLHVGRAAWVAFAVVPFLRRRWTRSAVVAYPFVMTLATMVTANHWLLDGVAGVAALGLAYVLERARLRAFPGRDQGTRPSTASSPKRRRAKASRSGPRRRV